MLKTILIEFVSIIIELTTSYIYHPSSTANLVALYIEWNVEFDKFIIFMLQTSPFKISRISRLE